MVLKSQLLFMIAIISGFLLTLQLITLQLIVSRSKPDSNAIWRSLYAITTIASSNDVSLFLIDPFILANISQRSDYKRLFGHLDAKQDSSIFPSGQSSQPNYCKVICQEQKVTRLAALGEYLSSSKLKAIKKQLEEKGYTVIHLTDQAAKDAHSHDNHHDTKQTTQSHYLYQSVSKTPVPPTKASLSLPQTLHLIVLDEKLPPKEGHVVIISVFHERLRDNWFRGKLQVDAADERLLYRQGVRKSHLLHWTEMSTLIPKTEVDAMIMDGLVVNMPRDVSHFIHPSRELDYIECNITRAKEFHDKFPYNDKDSELNRLFRLIVRRILFSAKEILDSLEIPFWLSSGTLLGHFRECDAFHYGMDVDIGVFIEDLEAVGMEKLIDSFSKNHLPLMHLFGMMNDSLELSFRNEDIKLDIFFFYREDSYVWNGGTSTKTGFKYKYTFPPFDLCWTNFLDLKVRIPCPTLPYIEANYGKDWFTPKRDWDWKTSPPNVSPNGQWPYHLWPQVIQSFSLPSQYTLAED